MTYGAPDLGFTGADRWHPSQPTTSTRTSNLTHGQIVIAGRHPFRIDRVQPLETGDWPDVFIEAWREQGRPTAENWWGQPYWIAGYWEHPDADQHIHSAIAPGDHPWRVLPEHYNICHLCHELPPCTYEHTETIIARASARLAQDMAILPSCCHSCREPITSRQSSFTFPGANLIRPDLGESSAIFHTRGRCARDLHAYDALWAAAEPGRARLLYCHGVLVIHFDGTLECSAARCPAREELQDVVDHRLRTRHLPADALNSRPTGAGCWCLADSTGETR
jgi:hypothetical protein